MQATTQNISEQAGLRQRLKWILTFRIAFASVLLCATLFWSWMPGGELRLFGPSFLGVFTITAAHLIAALGFFSLFKRRPIRRIWGFAVSQICWDLFFTTSYVSVTGGLDSGYQYLYLLPIVVASVLLFRLGAFIAAAFSGFMYGALLNLQYFGLVIPLFHVSVDTALWPEDRIWRSIIIWTAGFFLIAYVFGSLSNYLKQAETMLVEKSADLEDLEALMGRIVESMTSGLVTLDSAGRISFWSRSAEEITGFRLDQVRGRPFREVFPKADDSIAFDSIPKNFELRPWRWEMKFKKNLDEERTLGFSVSPLRHGTNGQAGTLIIFQDLTQYRAMEEQVKRADRMAAIGELSARIAHEIRNPLTSVSGSIEVLKNNLMLGAREKKLMDIVIRETDRLNQLLTDFLTFARPSEPNVEDVDLDQLLKETTELFTKSLQNGNVSLKLEIQDGVIVRGDSRQLNQMIWNLMKNASEASPKGEAIKVVLRRDRSGHNAVIEVTDQGAGVPKEHKEKIFTPFFTTKPKGTGLGLAIVRRIAEEHFGDVSIDANEGVGTVFRVLIPMMQTGNPLERPV